MFVFMEDKIMDKRGKMQREVPKSGKCDDMIIRLEKYISQFDSEWYQSIEGVSEQKIEELKSVLQLNGKGYDFPTN